MGLHPPARDNRDRLDVLHDRVALCNYRSSPATVGVGVRADASQRRRGPVAAASTIPVDNRLCGLAQRLLDSFRRTNRASLGAMQDFYTEAASFTDGDIHGEFVAASRFYKEVNDIATKADWDIERIVRNGDGARWKALLTGTPTGVEESRNDIRVRCRANLPAPPSIEVDGSGRIRDPVLAKLLAPIDKEIHRPAPPPEPEPTNERAAAAVGRRSAPGPDRAVCMAGSLDLCA